MLSPSAGLVSVNDHIVEPPDLWSLRLPRRLVEFAPRVVDTTNGSKAWCFGSVEFPTRSIFDGSDRVVGDERRIVTMFKAAVSARSRLAAMDRDGVEVHTLMPFDGGFAGERLLHVDRSARQACVKVYNDYVLDEYCSVCPERLLPVAIVVLDDPLAAAAEVERTVSGGARAVTFPSAPGEYGLPSLHTRHWDPLFAAVSAAGVPLVLHIGTSGRSRAAPDAPFGALLCLANLDAPASVVDLAFSGILDRFPRLVILVVEGGAGWLPFVEEQVDVFWRRTQNLPRFAANPSRPPSESIRLQVGVALIHDESGFRQWPDIGASRLYWQSDFPHPDSTWPQGRGVLESALAEVPDGIAEAIAGGNARRLFHLESKGSASNVG